MIRGAIKGLLSLKSTEEYLSDGPGVTEIIKQGLCRDMGLVIMDFYVANLLEILNTIWPQSMSGGPTMVPDAKTLIH